jgi:hypothetical protein
MFSRSINDTFRVIRMTIVGDATTYSITSDDSRGVIYDHNNFIIEAIGPSFQFKSSEFVQKNISNFNLTERQFENSFTLASLM